MEKLSEYAGKILNDETCIAVRDEWFARMRNLFDGKGDPFLDTHFLALNGVIGNADADLLYEEPEVWVNRALEDLAGKVNCIKNEEMFVPLCIEPPFYGVHFIDKIMGAEVFFQGGQWYNHYLDQEVGCLERPDLENNKTWELARRAASAFTEAKVGLPLFGLPTIASALNIATNLYGEEILVAMLTEPEAAAHDLGIINDLLCEIHQWYREHIPACQLQPVISWNRTQPPGYGQLCGCTTQLLSASLYEEFIMPLDDKLLAVYPDGGMIHFCGSHTHLLEVLRNMPHLKAVQLNDRAAWDLKEYYEGLREDQMIYLNPCEGMGIKQAIEITGGRRLVIADTVEHSGYEPAESFL